MQNKCIIIYNIERGNGMNTIFTRRSVRSFLKKTVEAEKIEKILRAAMQAPTAANGQPWQFIVVTGDENLEKLSEFNPHAKSLIGASHGIIVLGDKNKMKVPDMWQQDLGAATQNLMLEAAEQGLGSCWFGTAPVAERMDFIRELYNLSSDLMPYAVISIGYPKEADANKFVDRYDESAVRYIK